MARKWKQAYVGPFKKTEAEAHVRSLKRSFKNSPYLSKADKDATKVSVRKAKKGYQVWVYN